MRLDPSPERFRDPMATDDPDFAEVLACVFGVQGHEVRTYRTLLDAPGSTVEELATALERDRSNVNRSLSTLREKGLARRERRLLDGGGHVYQYTATPLSEARELMHEALDGWAAAVHDSIDAFEGNTAGGESA
ncbi:helix-turn-helix domain-containing protein [Haloarcula onubensis]|uniref:MarR family transcriptional regulator n=1 Tax=Haloarcula onubensis TaxID=2950539 RepID=A0ABU2FQI3_9EURY|nr:helix-turn-helix domain-containing protein [Halomicroarcula sp. S3CR25-11]MDS0282536.1 MarR family transcriptional regulator [Halomicroarcula sp. S3CR25-11]